MALQIRRGTDLQRSSQIFNSGELIYTTDQKHLWIGDGSTTGGTNVHASAAGAGLTWNPGTNKLDLNPSSFNFTTNDIIEGSNSKFFTVDRAQDAVGTMLQNGVYTGISFSYNSTTNTISATVSGGSGIASVSADVNPSLGANLGLASHNITGAGNINITGNISATGTITATTGLGANLNLNSSDVTGTGNINITGNIASTGTITATTGLGANLNLNSKNITGTGSINITGNIASTGTITATTGLGSNLNLNSSDIIGTGNISITGNITSTGTNTSHGASSIIGVANISGFEASLNINSSRSGTAVLQNNDIIGATKFAAWSGSQYTAAGVLFSQMASNVSSNLFAADTGIYTLNADGTFRPFWFRNTGLFEVLGVSLSNLTTTQINSFAGSIPNGTLAYNNTLNRLVVFTATVAESVVTTVAVPSTSTSSGVPGQIASDSSYVYICTALNTWMRASIASW